MRVLKDDKYAAILQAARREFIEKGFKDTSMRSVARSSGVGLSNIYNYFKNKDELYQTILRPATTALYHYIDSHHKEDDVHFDQLSSPQYQQEMIEGFIYLIEKYRTELYMLLYQSDQSMAKNFHDTFTDHMTRMGRRYFVLMKKCYPQANTDISDFFIHTFASWTISILGEMITHDLDEPGIRDFFREYFIFTTAGWRQLIGL